MSTDESQLNETTTLLSRSSPIPLGDDVRRPVSFYSLHRVSILLTCLVFVIVTGSALTQIPTLRVLEDAICQRLLVSLLDEPGEGQCKGNDVQSELAIITGTQYMLEAIPGTWNERHLVLRCST